VLRKAVQAERQPVSGALLQHLEAQPVSLNELGLYIRHSVTLVPIQWSLGQLAFCFEPRRSRPRTQRATALAQPRNSCVVGMSASVRALVMCLGPVLIRSRTKAVAMSIGKG
jgi:hypothetical protein